MPDKNTKREPEALQEAMTPEALLEVTMAMAPPEAPEDTSEDTSTGDPPAGDQEAQDNLRSQAAIGMSSDMGAMLTTFMDLMNRRDEELKAYLDARLAAIKLPEVNGAVRESPAEMAAPPGEHPPGYNHLIAQGQDGTLSRAAEEAQLARRRSAPRMVAFIPKEDPLNPRQTTFQTWINGRELRSKRGQVMILTMGHGIDLARNGHGNCVDIAAMQGVGVAQTMQVQQNPDFARSDAWNGLPLDGKSSFDLAAIR